MPAIDQILRAVAVGAIPVLFAITLHEVAHGRAARHFGDRTAELLGRLSLNPVKHIDPVGTVAVPLLLYLTTGFLFGWAKPVPVGYNNLRNPKRDMAFVAVAGPAANFVMAVGWALLFKGVIALGATETLAGAFTLEMARIGIFINILLAAFNLLPLPPLDGGRVLRGLVSEPLGKYLDAIEPFGLIIVALLLFTGYLGVLVTPLLRFVESLVLFLVGF
jgi:Zn-dependent protease